jgi:hypothetical protein
MLGGFVLASCSLWKDVRIMYSTGITKMIATSQATIPTVSPARRLRRGFGAAAGRADGVATAVAISALLEQ